jgi:putative transposase
LTRTAVQAAWKQGSISSPRRTAPPSSPSCAALVARGLAGVRLVTSDAHPGLVAIAATPPGASWQRCRMHFMRNLLTRVPKSAQSFVATMVRSIFAQPDAESVREQHARIVAQLEGRFPEAAALLDEAGPEILAFTNFRRSTGASSGRTTRSSG